MTRLILVRHGETDHNLENKYCGFSDPPLNDKGIRQARRLADRLKETRIDKVYSSDLKRAYQTADIVFKDRSIEKFSDLREMNFGIFEGLKYEEIIKKYPELYREWIIDPIEVKIPGGEGLVDLSKRVKKRLHVILSRHKGENVAVITHGGPIGVILCEDLRRFWQIKQELGALNIIDYTDGLSPLVVKENDSSHIKTKEESIL